MSDTQAPPETVRCPACRSDVSLDLETTCVTVCTRCLSVLERSSVGLRAIGVSGRLRDHGTVGWYVVRVQDPSRSNAIAQQIDALFKNSDAETKTQSEKEFNLAFVKQFGDVGMIVSAIMAAVFFTVLLLTANTLSQAMRERIPELAVLKTLGFSNATVCGLVLGESVLLLLMGGLGGLLASTLLLPALNGKLGAQLPPLSVTPGSWALGLAIMLGIGLLVGLPPALRAMRLRIVDALADR